MNITIVFNQLILTTIVSKIKNQLPEPTLIYYDEDLADILSSVTSALPSTHSVYIQSAHERLRPELPAPLSLVNPRSTVLFGKDPDKVFKSLRLWRLWDARHRLLIIIPKESEAQTWISLAWKITRAVNVVVLTMEAPEKFQTWFPYDKNCNDIIHLKAIDHRRLFPDKISGDLNGCPFWAVASFLSPMTITETTGIETRLVLTMAKKLNLTLKFGYLPTTVKSWNFFNISDGSPIYSMKRLVENDIDITYCNLWLSLNPSMWSEYLIPYMEDDQAWFVPSPKKISRAEAIIWAFPAKTWMAVFIIFFVVTITGVSINIIETGRSADAFVKVLALNLNQPTSNSQSKVLRILTIAVYVYSLHITTAYQSSLIVFLTDIPREKAITTPQQLADSNYPVQFLLNYQETIESHDRDFIQQIRTRSRYVSSLQLLEVATGEVALLGPKRAFSFYVDSNYFNLFKDELGYPHVLVLKEALVTTALTMYMSLGHPLVPVLRKYFRYLVEGGFPNHFTHMEETQPANILREKEPFELDNVMGAFYLLLINLGVSVFVLVVEILYVGFLKIFRKKASETKQQRRLIYRFRCRRFGRNNGT